MKNVKKILLIMCALFLVILIGCGKNYDVFAQCLTDNGVKFYGAYWCPHCQNQKNLFGSSFNNVNYIECSLPEKSGQNELCNQENIKKYPTWEFADGNRVEDVIPLKELSRLSGCSLEAE
jgi:hypothetical protein